MKSKIWLLPLLFLFLANSAPLAAQTPKSPEYYDTNTVYYKEGFFGDSIVKGDEEYKITSFGGSKELRDLLSQSPQAKDEIEGYRRKGILASSLVLTATSLYAGGLVTLVHLDRNEPSTAYISLGLLGGSLLTLIIAVFPSVNSYNHLHRAMWKYNRYVLYDSE